MLSDSYLTTFPEDKKRQTEVCMKKEEAQNQLTFDNLQLSIGPISLQQSTQTFNLLKLLLSYTYTVCVEDVTKL